MVGDSNVRVYIFCNIYVNSPSKPSRTADLPTQSAGRKTVPDADQTQTGISSVRVRQVAEQGQKHRNHQPTQTKTSSPPPGQPGRSATTYPPPHPGRQRLAQLLAQEDQLYQQDIVALQETPEQTRERMARRVKELKEEKEKRRMEEVNAKLDRRFEQNADELRKVDQDLKQLKLAY